MKNETDQFSEINKTARKMLKHDIIKKTRQIENIIQENKGLVFKRQNTKKKEIIKLKTGQYS